MARTFLTPEINNWLNQNYGSASNEELARQVTDLIKDENEKQIKKLKQMREFITQPALLRKVDREIKWRRAFKNVSVSYIKNVAGKMKHLRKDEGYLSSLNKVKAQRANLIKWVKKAQVVKDPLAWLRTFNKGETRICKIIKPSDIKMIRNATSNYNSNESLMSGMYFVTDLIKEVNLLRVKSIPNNKKK